MPLRQWVWSSNCPGTTKEVTADLGAQLLTFAGTPYFCSCLFLGFERDLKKKIFFPASFSDTCAILFLHRAVLEFGMGTGEQAEEVGRAQEGE